MQHGAPHLFASRRFLPLFVAQFLGAANDNLFKNALIILVVYRLGAASGVAPQILVTAAAGLFILPFFLFSATAGDIADRFEKTRLVRLVKLAELPVTILGAAALALGNPWVLLAVLFLLGTQATFFGPLKYALLPELLAETDLLAGNALVEGGTFLAILLGTIAGGLLILTEHGVLLVSGLMLTLSGLGWAASLLIPPAHAARPGLRLGLNIVKDTWTLLADLRQRRAVFLAALGISWFWFVGATFLAQFPAFAKDVLHADEQMVTLLLTMFSLGIGLGSLLCSRLLKGEISARHVPLAGLGITLFTLDLALAAHGLPPAEGVRALSETLGTPGVWRVLADLLMIAVCGGVYIVPLYTILQSRSAESRRARAVAANNVLNALFMVASAVGGALLLAREVPVTGVLLATGVVNLGAAAMMRGVGR